MALLCYIASMVATIDLAIGRLGVDTGMIRRADAGDAARNNKGMYAYKCMHEKDTLVDD